jgi:hypothetical protein
MAKKNIKNAIFVELDEEITAVCAEIKKAGKKKVYLVVPSGALLFKSVVNLQIVKAKAEEMGTKITIVTNDTNGLHLCQKLEIEFQEEIFPEEKEGEEDGKLSPLKATINSLENQNPKRLKERKISIGEFLTAKRKSLELKKVNGSSKKRKLFARKKKLNISTNNKKALVTLISISLVLLLFVVYIALPGATLIITPKANKIEATANITLADAEKNRQLLEVGQENTIASYPLSVQLEEVYTFQATGERATELAKRSEGFITIYNTTENNWPLIEKTRFQTDSGLVFRIVSPVNVPAADGSQPGTLKVFVVADEVDANGTFIGERGNIGPSKFFLPGLSEERRTEIYAESAETFQGGITDFTAYVTAEDLEGAQKASEEKIKIDALTKLKQALLEKARGQEEQDFRLLEGDKTINQSAIEIADVNLDFSGVIAGDELSNFNVKATTTVSGIYYSQAEMNAVLSEKLEAQRSPKKQLIKINTDNTSYRVFEQNDARSTVKITASIQGIEQFEISEDSEDGKRLLEKIVDHIVGLPVENAENFIQNLPEINKVEIETWPAWSPTIPNIPDNIDFTILEPLNL